MGIRRQDEDVEPVESLAPTAPDDLDQSEWDGRETSDTSAIKDLFGTAAISHLGGSTPAAEDTGTRMMPAVDQPAHAPAPGRSRYGAPGATPAPAADAGGRDNFINEGFARLQGEGRRGKRWFVIGAIALIVVMLVAVFFLTRWIVGNNLDNHLTPTKSPTPAAASPATDRTAAASSSPEAAAPTIAFATSPAGPGEHSWRELAGGECLSPYTDAWADTYTVVDCAAPHQAQLTARGAIESETFPGADVLRTEVAAKCQDASTLDTAAASAYSDIQVQGSYPADQTSWDQGDRSWSCYVSRSSGAELTGSLAPTA